MSTWNKQCILVHQVFGFVELLKQRAGRSSSVVDGLSASNRSGKSNQSGHEQTAVETRQGKVELMTDFVAAGEFEQVLAICEELMSEVALPTEAFDLSRTLGAGVMGNINVMGGTGSCGGMTVNDGVGGWRGGMGHHHDQQSQQFVSDQPSSGTGAPTFAGKTFFEVPEFIPGGTEFVPSTFSLDELQNKQLSWRRVLPNTTANTSEQEGVPAKNAADADENWRSDDKHPPFHGSADHHYVLHPPPPQSTTMPVLPPPPPQSVPPPPPSSLGTPAPRGPHDPATTALPPPPASAPPPPPDSAPPPPPESALHLQPPPHPQRTMEELDQDLFTEILGGEWRPIPPLRPGFAELPTKRGTTFVDEEVVPAHDEEGANNSRSEEMFSAEEYNNSLGASRQDDVCASPSEKEQLLLDGPPRAPTTWVTQRSDGGSSRFDHVGGVVPNDIRLGVVPLEAVPLLNKASWPEISGTANVSPAHEISGTSNVVPTKEHPEEPLTPPPITPPPMNWAARFVATKQKPPVKNKTGAVAPLNNNKSVSVSEQQSGPATAFPLMAFLKKSKTKSKSKKSRAGGDVPESPTFSER